MSAITSELVKTLREKTGAGMMDCKKALLEVDGDLEKAIDFLRKAGTLKAAKKSSRVTAEGLINIQSEGAITSLVEVNCETDFVAKNEDFLQFLSQTNQTVLQSKPQNLDALLTAHLVGHKGVSVGERVAELIAVIGENISVRRFAWYEAKADEQVGSYTHMGNKIGVLVKVQGLKDANPEVLKNLAMHVAAMAPRYLQASQVPADVLAREKEIYQASLQEQDKKKPAQIVEKILEGKMKKFYDEVCLENQIYIRDPSGKQKISDYLKSVSPKALILEFVRFQVGEGIEKRQESFAEEVAKLQAS